MAWSCRAIAATSSTAPEFTPEAPQARSASASSMAYRQSAATLNLLRAFAQGGYANLEHVHQLDAGLRQGQPAGERYEELADRITEALGFMRACGINPETAPQLRHDGFLHQPRGAAARLRAGDDPRRIRPAATGTPPRATCCGSATAPASPITPMSSSAAASRIRSASNAGRRSKPDELIRLIDMLEPGGRAGPPDADLPLRRRQGREAPAGADPRREAGGPERRVVVRSDARQHHQGGRRLQDAAVRAHPDRGAALLRHPSRPRARMPAASMSR